MNGYREVKTLESAQSAKVHTGTDRESYRKINKPPCRKCGLTARNTDGKCPDCTKKRTAIYYEKHKKRLIAQRKAHAATLSGQEKKERNRKYKLRNQEKYPGKSQEQSRARYAKDPEKHKRYYAKYRNANREKIKERDAARYKANPKKTKAWNDAYRAANLEKERARNVAWAKENPDNVQMRCALRRARKLNATTEIFLRTEIFDRDKWVCQICHKKVNKKLKYPDPMSASLDHTIPLSRGGAHSRKNTQLTHLVCNEKAGVGGIKQLRMFG